MCGIFGYIRSNAPAQEALSVAFTCLNGLRRLEYRGYDSSGIAGIQDGALVCKKQVGKLSELAKRLEENPLHLDLGIAHVRWATHGKASENNAHPHVDEHGTTAVVHNGIIENHAELRRLLLTQGVTFTTQTDSEVIAQLIGLHYHGDLVDAVQTALDKLEGLWAVAVIHKDHPDQIIVAAKGSSVVVGIRERTGESWIASDANAFQGEGIEAHFLASGQLASVQAGRVFLYNRQREPVLPKAFILQGSTATTSKNGYDHYMLKEISEQTTTIAETLRGRILDGVVSLEGPLLQPGFLQTVEEVVLIGCGTSWHAAQLAAYLIEQLAGIPARAEIASEYRYQRSLLTKRSLLIAISQSGETIETVSAVRSVRQQLAAPTLALCNVPQSTLSREVDQTLDLRAGPEISVCSTKAFTSQVVLLTLVALQLASAKGVAPKILAEVILALEHLPAQVAAVLEQRSAIAALAAQYRGVSHVFCLGRQLLKVAASEIALKVKEVSYCPAEAHAAGEMKHGPIALVDEKLLAIGLLGANVELTTKTEGNLSEIEARGGSVLVFSTGPASAQDRGLQLPSCHPVTEGILHVVAGQLFAYFFALSRGIQDIDQPRNLAKSVTVE